MATRPHYRAPTGAPSIDQLRRHPHSLRSITKANEAAALMREEGISLSAAARAKGMDTRTLRQYLDAYGALERAGRRGYRAGHLKDAPLLQQFLAEGPDGTPRARFIPISDPAEIRELGRYWSAIERYQAKRNINGAKATITSFSGREVVDSFGRRWAYVTDLRLIDEWLRVPDDVTQPIQSP
jgi:hypothetical protein